jgi:hypothetical protein
LTIFAANGFYSYEGQVRELVNGTLLPIQLCTGCGVEVVLCFGTDTNDVCCGCVV